MNKCVFLMKNNDDNWFPNEISTEALPRRKEIYSLPHPQNQEIVSSMAYHPTYVLFWDPRDSRPGAATESEMDALYAKTSVFSQYSLVPPRSFPLVYPASRIALTGKQCWLVLWCLCASYPCQFSICCCLQNPRPSRLTQPTQN